MQSKEGKRGQTDLDAVGARRIAVALDLAMLTQDAGEDSRVSLRCGRRTSVGRHDSAQSEATVGVRR